MEFSHPAQFHRLIQISARLVFAVTFYACARVSVTPQAAQQPDPVRAYDAIESERFAPTEIVVRDFDFDAAAVHENASPLHRLLDWIRPSSSADRQEKIGRAAVETLSNQTVKRLQAAGLYAIRYEAGTDARPPNDALVIAGRLLNVDEGNRLTRVGVGLGAGESRFETEVHAFRLANGERAEVLAFKTYADSGKMPGVAESVVGGWMITGPITLFEMIEQSASSGEKIYQTQMNHLASQTGDQVAGYLTQYAAAESWITASNARSVNLASD